MYALLNSAKQTCGVFFGGHFLFLVEVVLVLVFFLVGNTEVVLVLIYG